jgi:hypothetical protein
MVERLCLQADFSDVAAGETQLDSPAEETGEPEVVKQKQSRQQLVVRSLFFDALVPILTTQVGRNEAGALACQLLREIARASREDPRCYPIQMALEYIQPRLVAVASSSLMPPASGSGGDLSKLVWNDLYPPSFIAPPLGNSALAKLKLDYVDAAKKASDNRGDGGENIRDGHNDGAG